MNVLNFLPKNSIIIEAGTASGYETDLEKLKNTFIYFHLIANSKKIKSYTEYSWTSGFVWWCKQIYDIPLEVVKL